MHSTLLPLRMLLWLCRFSLAHSFVNLPSWDHFGGLVPLLSSSHDLRCAQKGDCENATKRPRRESGAVPTVMAPDSVLKYLSLCFEKDASDYFHALSLQNPAHVISHKVSELARRDQVFSKPHISWLQKVRVDHCPFAYGFVLGIYEPFTSGTFLFCFSGDTRPCQEFVKACRFYAQHHGKSVDFLLHE